MKMATSSSENMPLSFLPFPDEDTTYRMLVQSILTGGDIILTGECAMKKDDVASCRGRVMLDVPRPHEAWHILHALDKVEFPAGKLVPERPAVEVADVMASLTVGYVLQGNFTICVIGSGKNGGLYVGVTKRAAKYDEDDRFGACMRALSRAARRLWEDTNVATDIMWMGGTGEKVGKMSAGNYGTVGMGMEAIK